MSEAGAGPRVALTFDAEHPDRPAGDPANATRILDALAAAGAAATFFIQGRWALAYPDLARRVAEDGHLIGNHSHYHARMPLFSDDGIREDVEEAEAVVRDATGADPRPWFRCPFGAGYDDERVGRVLETLGYRNVHWHVELGDWEPSRTAGPIAADAIAGAAARGDGAVVLLHTWPTGTAGAVPNIVEGLKNLGATFVRVDQLEPELLP